MIRFIIKRKLLARGSACEQEAFETFDVDCQELEHALLGGFNGTMGYDVRHLAGVEILPSAVPIVQARPEPKGQLSASEVEPLLRALRLAKSAIIQGHTMETKIAANGPTLGSVIDGALGQLETK